MGWMVRRWVDDKLVDGSGLVNGKTDQLMDRSMDKMIE